MPSNAELARDVEALRLEIAGMHESLRMINQLYEESKEKYNAVSAENKTLVKENEKLSRRIADLEQYSRINNVEIRGVPSTQGESCVAVLQKIGEKIGCHVPPTDLDTVHRVPAKKDKNIIARFCSRTKKAEFISKARKARLNATTLGFPPSAETKVFVNDHLTQENKRLFAQALELKKQHNWRFLWTDNCRIKARKTEGSRVYVISCTSDLSLITP